MDPTLSLFPRFVMIAALLPACAMAHDAVKKSFDVPAGSAAQTLRRAASQAGRQIVYDGAALRNVRTPALRGEYTPLEALNRLLAGTELRVEEDAKTGALAVTRKPSAAPPAPSDSPSSANVGPQNDIAQPPSMKTTTPRTWLAGLLLWFATSDPSSAQSTTSAATPSQGDVTVLSPFEVNVGEDTGYQAMSTVSGSRLNTRLKDTAAPISVFTDELLNDIGATSFLELAEWAVGAELNHHEDNANENELLFGTGKINVRGLLAAKGRNFYQWEMSTDTYNTERIEMSSGPNAILFGLGSPGGMFNAMTKRAQTSRDFLTVQNRVGFYHLFRNQLDANKTLIKDKLAIRVNLLKQESESWRQWEWNDSERAHAALTWRVTGNSVFRAEWETGKVHQNTARNYATYLSHQPWTEAHAAALVAAGGNASLIPENSAGGFFNAYRGGSTFTVIPGLPNTVEQQLTVYPIYNTQTGVLYNAQGEVRSRDPVRELVWDDPYSPNHIWVKGPHDYRTQELDTYSLNFETRLAKGLHFEAGYNYQDTMYDHRNNDRKTAPRVDLNLTLPDGSPNPNVGRYFVEGEAQLRIRNLERKTYRGLLSYELNLTEKNPWLGRHRFAALYEDARINTDNARLSLVVAQNNLTGFNASNQDVLANYMRFRTYVDIYDPDSIVWGGPTELVDQPIVMSTPRFLRASQGEQSITGERISTEWAHSTAEDKAFFDDMNSEMAVMQNYWFRDRFITVFGLRREILDRHGIVPLPQLDPTGRVEFGPSNPEHYSNTSRSMSALYHVNKAGNLSLFYNWGSNFRTPDPAHLVVGLVSPPVGRGESQDVGVKFDLLQGRLSGSVLRYQTKGTNLTINAGRPQGMERIFNLLNDADREILDPEGVPLTNATVGKWNLIPSNAVVYDNESEGYELSLVANPTSSLRVFFNYSYTETFGTNAGTHMVAYLDKLMPYAEQFIGQFFTGTRDDVLFYLEQVYDHLYNNQFGRNGYAPRGYNKHKANLRLNYSWKTGRLKGFSLGGGAMWRSAPVIGNLSAGGRQDGEVPLWADAKPFNWADRTPIYGEEEFITFLNFGYQTRFNILGRNTSVVFQVNIDNVLDDTDPVVTSVVPIDEGYRVTGYRFVKPRQINLTTTFKF
jgi:iron complex outermembrane receptor protein